jgi:hypothetical protein
MPETSPYLDDAIKIAKFGKLGTITIAALGSTVNLLEAVTHKLMGEPFTQDLAEAGEIVLIGGIGVTAVTALQSYLQYRKD